MRSSGRGFGTRNYRGWGGWVGGKGKKDRQKWSVSNQLCANWGIVFARGIVEIGDCIQF